MKRINFDISNFDQIKAEMIEKRNKQSAEEKEYYDKQMGVLNVLERQPQIESKTELTEQEIQEALEFKKEMQEARSKRVRGTKTLDLISGTVFRSKTEDFVPTAVTIKDCKNVRDEMEEVMTVASEYTDTLIKNFAPELMDEANKELKDTFVEKCGSISSYDLANLTFEVASDIINPVKKFFITAELLSELDVIDELDPNPESIKSKQDFYTSFSKEIITKFKATTITKNGVDAFIPVMTNYLEKLLYAVGAGENPHKAEEDEINRLRLSIQVCREYIIGILNADKSDLDDIADYYNELQEELKFIDSMSEKLTAVSNLDEIIAYIDRIQRKLKLDLKKTKDVDNSILKLCGGMINSKRKFPVPGSAESAAEVKGILTEFITATMLTFDFGLFFANNAGKSNEEIISGYTKSNLQIGNTSVNTPDLSAIDESKELIQKLYIVNTDKQEISFNVFLAELMGDKYKYFRERANTLLYIISRIYARSGRIDEDREFELILTMDIISKLIFGENVKRISSIYKKLDELGL